MDVRQFRVFVEPLSSDLGGGFVSYAPDLKGCVSDGDTPDDAFRNIYDAAASWLEAARRNGEPVPEPVNVRQFA